MYYFFFIFFRYSLIEVKQHFGIWSALVLRVFFKFNIGILVWLKWLIIESTHDSKIAHRLDNAYLLNINGNLCTFDLYNRPQAGRVDSMVFYAINHCICTDNCS